MNNWTRNISRIDKKIRGLNKEKNNMLINRTSFKNFKNKISINTKQILLHLQINQTNILQYNRTIKMIINFN